MLWSLLACPHAPQAPPTLEDCAAGQLDDCRALAAVSPLVVARGLDRWACDEGHGPSCLALVTDPTARSALPDLNVACGAGAAEACARLVAAGWKTEVVRRVDVMESPFPAALLPAGSALVGVDAGGLTVATKEGLRHVSLEDPKVPEATRPRVRGAFALRAGADGALAGVLDVGLPALWDPVTGGLDLLAGTRVPVAPFSFRPTGGLLAGALGAPGDVGIAWWDAEGAPLGTTPTGELPTAFGWSADGRRMAVAAGRQVLLVDVVNRRVVERFEAQATALAVLPKDVVIGVGSKGLWARGPGGEARELARIASALALSPDGSRIAVTTGGSLELRSGDDLAVLSSTEVPERARALVWEPDGERIAVIGDDRAFLLTLAGAASGKGDDRALLEAIRTLRPLPGGADPLRTLEGGGRIEGKVTGEGRPVRGAVVRATGPRATVRETTTDATGRYVFADLLRGPWTLAPSAFGWAPAAPAVDLAAAPSRTVDIALSPVPVVAGIVRDARGRPAAGVTVWSGTSRALTDEKGAYQVEVPALPAPVDAVLGDAVASGLAEGAAVDLRLAPGGTVIRALDERDAALPEQVVTLRMAGAPARSVRTGADGRARVLLAQGSWQADGAESFVSPAAEVVVRRPRPATVVVRPDRSAPEDVVSLDGRPCRPAFGPCEWKGLTAGPHAIRAHLADHRWGASTVHAVGGEIVAAEVPVDGALLEASGTVEDGEGHPVAAVRVTVRCGAEGGAQSATTGPDGRFRFARVPPGKLAIELDSRRIGGRVEPAEIVAGEAARLVVGRVR